VHLEHLGRAQGEEAAVDLALDEVVRRLEKANVPIIEGPVARTGAKGKMRSVYVRDPDLNLVEVSVYQT
jgi:catechol 2,3-dioxygenase-like lactoylglutathione lyase family enzyme